LSGQEGGTGGNESNSGIGRYVWQPNGEKVKIQRKTGGGGGVINIVQPIGNRDVFTEVKGKQRVFVRY